MRKDLDHEFQYDLTNDGLIFNNPFPVTQKNILKIGLGLQDYV